MGLVLVLAVFAGFGTLGWYFAKDRIRSQDQYRLSADKITVSPFPPPDWVSDRFVEEVLETSGLNRAGALLDNTLPLKLTEAFAAYPWVAEVEQVLPQYPSGAKVKLSYREPVALVEIPQRGLFPVDSSGVLLPAEYLKYLSDTNSDRRNQHFFIQGIPSMPRGLAGTPWGDPLVQAAAQLAAELSDIAEPLKLVQIIPAVEATPGGARIVCRLKTAGGTEVYWGSFASDDPKTETKKKRLLNLHEQFRSLDNVPAQFRPIDLSKE